MKNNISFIKTVKYVLKSVELRKKLILTVLVLLFFRLGASITIPGVHLNNSGGLIPGGGDNAQSLSNLIGMLGGGGLRQFSVFALGLSPYIMATVIVQLLSADVIPAWSRLAKSGENGRKKLDLYGRYITIFIAITQAYAVTAALQSSGSITISSHGFLTITYLILVLLGGSFLSLWLGDIISKKGLGNGISLIIFAGIVANLPWNFYSLFVGLFKNQPVAYIFTGILDAILYIFIFICLLVGTVFINQSTRKIPVQGMGSGLTTNFDEISYLPLRINSAGVIPVIFASAILTTPLTIAQIINNKNATAWVQIFFSTKKPLGILLYFLLIIVFTYFYSHITVNSEDISENFKKNGSFIPGIRPGFQTRKYIYKTLNRLNFIGGTILGFIAVFPYILSLLKNIPSQIAVGGTGIIIIVAVAIDTLTQIQGRIRQKSYAEFKSSENMDTLLNKSKSPILEENKTNDKKTKGLW